MKIIDLKLARQHQIKLEFDNGESLLVDKETAARFGLKKDMQIDNDLREKLVYDSAFTRAKSKAIYLLSNREYSAKEMRERLLRDGFDKDAVKSAVELLADAGVIDDERFAESFAYSLREGRKLGYYAIMRELTLKGVSSQIAERYASVYKENETETAKQIILTKYKDFASDEKIKRRMYSALQRKGYSFSTINGAIEHITSEQ